MISLIVPMNGCDYYVQDEYRGYIYGPFTVNLSYISEEIEFDLKSEQFSFTPGIYGENNLVHRHASAALEVIPAHASAKHWDAWPEHPEAVEVLSSRGILRACNGFAPNYRAWETESSSEPARKIFNCMEKVSPTKWRSYYCNYLYSAALNTTDLMYPEICDVEIYEISGSIARIRYTTRTLTRVYVDGQPRDPVALIQEALKDVGATIRTSPTWDHGRILPTALNIQSIKTYVSSISHSLNWVMNITPEQDYGDLAMKASEKVNNININMIAFLRDIRHPSDMIPKLKNLSTLRKISNTFLSVKYGILPTVSDIQCIIGSFRRIMPHIDKNGFKVYRSGHNARYVIDGDIIIDTDQRLKMAIEDEDCDFEALAQRLESFGVLPTFENVWDLLPYSFVVDWLVDVGGFLERVDTRLRLSRLNIPYVTMSYKVTAQRAAIPTQDHPVSGLIAMVHYHRWVTDHCPAPNLSLLPGSGLSNHWLEGGALLAQRKK